MNNTRALVSCTVLSLQDSCFVYPFCKCCLSRVTQESNKRATCARCGFTCDLQNVDYRYRLSIKVSRNQDIFGVTVFGGCLNSFFGITAGGLQRFMELEKSDGTHTIQQLLMKAVEDCFIGRCIVLGLKGFCDNVKTLSADQHTSSHVLKSRQLVACQIISPSEAFEGSTVIEYFKKLLQSNLRVCRSESANSSICLSQQKDSQSLQRDELNSFNNTLPSCARLNSQPSSGEFTLSSAWQSPGLCFTSEEISNDSLQSPKNEDMRTCQPSLEFLTEKYFWSRPVDHLRHDNGVQDELKDETQSNNRKSFTSSCDMFKSSLHANSFTACDPVYPLKAISCKNELSQCRLKAKSEEEYDAPFFDKSLVSHSGENMCLDLEDAPLSEDILDFVGADPRMSEIIDAKQLKFSNEHSSGKQDEIIQCQNRCFLTENSMLLSNKSKTASTIQSGENLEITINNVEIPKTPNVLCTRSSSGRKKKKMMLADLNINFSPDIVRVFHLPKNNRLCFSNRKDLTLQRKRLTRSRLSVALCSLNHEEGKCFCAQTEVHSANCKVKQEQNVCDDHGDTYNCSADLFASCQNSMDMNHSDVTEISKEHEPRNVNPSEPGVSDCLLFSPCLQSTPVSYQRSFRQKAGRSHKRVDSLCSTGLKLEFQSEITGLRENRQNKPKDTMSELDRLQIVGSIERFSGKSDVMNASFNSSVNVNEWSKDLFENSF